MNTRVLNFIILTLTSTYLTAMNHKEKAEIATGAKILKHSESAPARLGMLITISLHIPAKKSLFKNWMQKTVLANMPFNNFKKEIAQFLEIDSQRLLLCDNTGKEYPQDSKDSLSQLDISDGTKILVFK